MKLALGILLIASPLFASPMYPWYRQECFRVVQGDGDHVASVCSNYNAELQLDVLNVYYWGYLARHEGDYTGFYANLSVGGGGFWRRYLNRRTFGDGNNLPQRTVYHAQFIVGSHIDSRPFPTGQRFALYFQAEQKIPKNNPPFSYDNVFGNNYHGVIQRPIY